MAERRSSRGGPARTRSSGEGSGSLETAQRELDASVENYDDVLGDVQELESRQNRLADQNLATQSLLSSLQDTDFTEAISRFQTLQTSLQASLQTGASMLNLSLLDFLK